MKGQVLGRGGGGEGCGPGGCAFAGAFMMHKGAGSPYALKLKDGLPFPRKKLRDQLTHYSLGRVSERLLGALPEADVVRGGMAAAKHGSCAGFDDQLAYFRAVDERVAPKLAGAGAALVASSVGANVSYASLRAAFLRDSDGKDVALGCEGCDLSDVWFKVDSVTFAPVDYGGESTCAKCADVHVIDFAAEGCK